MVSRLFLLIQPLPSTLTSIATLRMPFAIFVLQGCELPPPFSIGPHSQELSFFALSASSDCRVDSPPSVPWLSMMSRSRQHSTFSSLSTRGLTIQGGMCSSPFVVPTSWLLVASCFDLTKKTCFAIFKFKTHF